MEKMFFGCKQLKAINVSRFNTEKVTRMDLMFDGCENLEFLDLSKFNIKSVESMMHRFS